MKDVKRISSLRRRVLYFGAVGVLLLPSIAFAQKVGECERETIATLMSPDNVWVALAEEHICSGEGLATTSLSDTIQLVRRGERPSDQNYVFAVDEHGDPSNRPLMQWLSSRKLQITVSNKALIGIKRRGFKDVEIVIKYNPDDPAERARFLKEQGLPPD